MLLEGVAEHLAALLSLLNKSHCVVGEDEAGHLRFAVAVGQ